MRRVCNISVAINVNHVLSDISETVRKEVEILQEFQQFNSKSAENDPLSYKLSKTFTAEKNTPPPP